MRIFPSTPASCFPVIVSIQRPIEGYGITISIVKLDVNVPLTDEQFVLTQPPGSQLINLDTQAPPPPFMRGEQEAAPVSEARQERADASSRS